MSVALLVAALVAPAPVQAAQLKLPPVDQCSGDAGFVQFRAALGKAVARRDAKALLELLAPDVTVNFGGDVGRKSFATQWHLDRPAKSGLWSELSAIAKLGCARVQQARVIPSLAGQFNPADDQDAFEKMIVTSHAARLRKSRAANSATVATLSWDVVTALEAPDDGYAIRVRTARGVEGWLSRSQLRSPLDYRAVVEKRKGRWMITAFVAGD